MKKLTMMAATLAAALFVSQAAFAADQDRPGGAQPAAGRDPAGGAGGAGAGARPGGTDRAAPADQPNIDQMFVRDATIGNLYEIQVGQLAQERAQSDEVKKMAQMLVQDHTQANQQLAQIAQSKKLDVPKDLDDVHKAKLAKFQQFQGQMFDKKFVIDQVTHHVHDVLCFRDAAQNVQDPELKAFASQTLPKLQQHLQHAQRAAGWSEAQPAGAHERGHGAGTTPGSTPGTTGDSRDTGRPGAGTGTSPGTGAGGTGTGSGTGAGGAGGGSGTGAGGAGGGAGTGTGTGGAGTSGSGTERPGTPR